MESKRDMFKKYKTIIILVSIPLIFIAILVGNHFVSGLITEYNTIRINDEFYFAPFEGNLDYCLHRDPLTYDDDISEAYWSKDSLVFKGSTGCNLIVFGTTQYNDEMIKIECDNLNNFIKNEKIDSLIR